MHVLVVVGEVVQVRVEVLELCAGVIALLQLEPDRFAQTRLRAVARNEVVAAHLFLHAADLEGSGYAVGVLFHVDARRVPVGRYAVVRARVLAQVQLGFALPAHEDVGIAGIELREVDPWPHFAAL